MGKRAKNEVGVYGLDDGSRERERERRVIGAEEGLQRRRTDRWSGGEGNRHLGLGLR